MNVYASTRWIFSVKALVNEDTLLPIMFLGLRKLGNICCGHKMFLNKIRNIFVSWTQNLCRQQMLRAQANGETFVSATMCPQQFVLVCQCLKKKAILNYKAKLTGGLEEQLNPQFHPCKILLFPCTGIRLVLCSYH